MADKVQKIREKVEKKLEVMQYQIHRKDAYKELKCILDYIDSLQEEPVNKELEKAANEWDAKASFTPFYMALDNNGNPYEVRQDYTTHAESFKAGAKWQKAKDESTTEDLGDYINELSKQFPEVSFAKLSRIAVRVAKWQKEQMMTKAVDGIARPYDNEIWCILDSFNLKDGDEVKVIVIKEGLNMNKTEDYISWNDMSEEEKAEFFKSKPFTIKKDE